jgi:hypothetical protein
MLTHPLLDPRNRIMRNAALIFAALAILATPCFAAIELEPLADEAVVVPADIIPADGDLLLKIPSDSGIAPATASMVETVVPEPTTIAIWGVLGGMGLIAIARRRKTA